MEESFIEKLGKQKMVYGDIRERNMMVNDKGDLKFIDSDWAGGILSKGYKLRSCIETTFRRPPSRGDSSCA